MLQPAQRVKVFGLLLFLQVFFMSVTMIAQAVVPIIMLDIQKQENLSYTRITFNFSTLPRFAMEHSGQRADLLLSDVQLSPQLHNLPEDDKVVKFLLAQKQHELMVSILLRRIPKQIITESKNNPPRVVMDIYWEADKGTRPGVAFRIADMPPRKAGKRASRYQRESPWKDRWDEFFRDYRTYWQLKLPVCFTLPQLPTLINDKQSPLWSLQQHVDNNMFLSLLQTATNLSGLDNQQLYLRDLLVAEAQLRTGAKEAAMARLDSLRAKKGTEQVRVEYLTAYGQALAGQPVVAQLRLQELLPKLAENQPLLPLIHLLFVETALASGHDRVALEHLQTTGLDWPDVLLALVELRIADAQAGLGDLDTAIAAYRNLAEKPGLFEFYQFSCNRAAFSAFKNKDYALATRLYRRLMELVKDEPGNDLILFATGASAYESGDLDWGMIGLQRATLDRPNSEGGDRAELRLIDHKLISGGELELAQATTEYRQLGKRSQFLPVREESRFKCALALYLLGEYRDSVDGLMRFRREFGSSKLRREVDLLLLEQVPKVVHQLLEQKNDLQAVVLVEQNRKLLLSSDFDKNFLHDLATAFDKLGLYEQSGRVLLYMFDCTTGKPEQQAFYLPLAQSFLKREEYLQASKYAGRYLEKYPQGEAAGALFGILLDAFERQERHKELLAWLNRKDRPRSPELEIRAAQIYWQLGKLQAVIESLERVRSAGSPMEVKEMALLGEAYYQLNNNIAAGKIYQQLQDDPEFSLQACYRTAQILLRQQKRKAALNLLTGMVEKDGNSFWGKLAQDLLIQEKR